MIVVMTSAPRPSSSASDPTLMLLTGIGALYWERLSWKSLLMLRSAMRTKGLKSKLSEMQRSLAHHEKSHVFNHLAFSHLPFVQSPP